MAMRYMLHVREWDSRKIYLFLLKTEKPKLLYILKHSNEIYLLTLTLTVKNITVMSSKEARVATLAGYS